MRHRLRGRTLGRTSSHRHAMFSNMAASLIKTVTRETDPEKRWIVPGRIETTVPKAKELRPYVEKLVTMARKAIPHQNKAAEFATTAARNSPEWVTWRKSENWQKWAKALAPAVALRRQAFALLRDKEATSVLFDKLGPMMTDRDGGYTRIVRLARVRQNDASPLAIIEFVGNERDRKKQRTAPVVEQAAN
jgi:large subunit ribosomal protein L17